MLPILKLENVRALKLQIPQGSCTQKINLSPEGSRLLYTHGSLISAQINIKDLTIPEEDDEIQHSQHDPQFHQIGFIDEERFIDISTDACSVISTLPSLNYGQIGSWKLGFTNYDSKKYAINADNTSIAIFFENRTKIHLFDLQTGKLQRVFDCGQPVSYCSFDPTGGYLVAGCKKGLVVVFTLLSGRTVSCLPVSNEKVWCCFIYYFSNASGKLQPIILSCMQDSIVASTFAGNILFKTGLMRGLYTRAQTCLPFLLLNRYIIILFAHFRRSIIGLLDTKNGELIELEIKFGNPAFNYEEVKLGIIDIAFLGNSQKLSIIFKVQDSYFHATGTFSFPE